MARCMHQLSDVRGGSGILDEGVERKIRARSAYCREMAREYHDETTVPERSRTFE
jgi:hypothetical protein